MRMSLILIVLVSLISAFQEANTGVKLKRTPVEFWCVGDDNLTQNVCHAAFKAFASAPDFDLESENNPDALIVTIPTNVDWKPRGKRTEVFYQVEFTTSDEKKLATAKGACVDINFNTCATKILDQARAAARKLPVKR